MRSSIQRLALTLLLLGTSPVRVVAQEQELDPLVRQVIQALEEQESQISTLSVEVKAVCLNNYAKFLGNGGNTRFTSEETWQVDPHGIGWCEGASDKTKTRANGSRWRTEVKHEAFFNGKSGMYLTTEFSPVLGSHSLSAQESMQLQGLTISPRDFTVAHQGELISTLLRRRVAQVVGEQEWRGQTLKILETEPIKNNGLFKSQFWVDVARGFSIVRRINLYQKSESDSWVPQYEVIAINHKQIEAAIWLPEKFERHSYWGQSNNEGSSPAVAVLTKGTCSDWSVNLPMQEDGLNLDVPRSVRVQPLRKPEPQNVVGLQNFFVRPVTTALQRRLVGEDVDAYAVIDVTSYVNVATKHLELEHCDFAEWNRQLREASDHAMELKEPDVKPTLFLRFDFGSVGTDETIGEFATTPVVAMAKSAGFGRVRTSKYFHGDALFVKPGENKGPSVQEENLGNERIDLFEVGTAISKYILSNTDFYLALKQRLEIDTVEILDEQILGAITESIADCDVNGKSLLIEFRLGDQRNWNPRVDSKYVPAREQDSKVQLQAVKKLRSLGFGDVKFSARIGNDYKNAFYRK